MPHEIENNVKLPRRQTGKPVYVCDDPLLSPAETAAERGQAISTFWRDVKNGRVPPAIYVTERRPRWRRSEILADLEQKRAKK
jgi:predicted DNA-binding transcriptional regulator AlpA